MPTAPSVRHHARPACRSAITLGSLALPLALPALAAAPAWAGSTERVSVSSAGEQANGGSSAPAISVDGRYVAFELRATNLVRGGTNGLGPRFSRPRPPGPARPSW